VQAVEGKRIQGLAVEDTVQLFVRTRGGAMGTVDLSWSLNKELDHFINIYGSGGTVRVGWSGSSYRRSSDSSWTSFGRGYDKLDAFRQQLENFRNAILGEEPLRITAEDALASVRVIEAAYRSLRENHWVKVDGLGA
jgi:predicted dehydrogenase